MSDKVILEAKNIRKEFGRRQERFLAVHPFNLELYEGECFGLVGESGSGKSTVGRMLSSLLKPDGGIIYFRGKDILKLRKEEKRGFYRHIQVVFQDPVSAVSPRMTIGTFLTCGMINFRLFSRAEASREALRLLERVGLPGSFLNRFPGELSGGELQRVVIARAISVRPDILILDEPTSALDVSVQKQILDLLTDLQKSLGITYLFISHDLAVVRRMAKRVGIMYEGHLVERMDGNGLTGSILHPYTRDLLEHAIFLGQGPGKLPPGEPVMEQTEAAQGCPYYSQCSRREDDCAGIRPELVRVGEGHEAACLKMI